MQLDKQVSTSAESKIRALAAKHHVTYTKTRLDDWANDVTRLAGDEVELDEVELQIVALARAKVLAPIDATMLHAAYLHERRD